MTYPVKYSEAEVLTAIHSTAKALQQNGIINDQTVYVVLLNGGVWFASHLFDCIGETANEVYYVKCHSYEGAERRELVWDYIPKMDLKGKQVLICDDICDSGQTATEAVRYLKNELQAADVQVVTLLSRTSTRLPDDIGLTSSIIDPSDDFFVGCGLDDNHRSRMLPYIGIIEK